MNTEMGHAASRARGFAYGGDDLPAGWNSKAEAAFKLMAWYVNQLHTLKFTDVPPSFPVPRRRGSR